MSIKELKEDLKIELDSYMTSVVLFYFHNYRDDFSIEEFFKTFKEVFDTWTDKFEKELINNREEN